MKAKWEREAREKVLKTAQQIEEEYGKLVAANFLEDVTNVVNLLEQMPYLGIVEPLLSRSKWKFRSIVTDKKNKLIYLVREDIVIVDFWDTRMNPTALVKQLMTRY